MEREKARTARLGVQSAFTTRPEVLPRPRSTSKERASARSEERKRLRHQEALALGALLSYVFTRTRHRGHPRRRRSFIRPGEISPSSRRRRRPFLYSGRAFYLSFSPPPLCALALFSLLPYFTVLKKMTPGCVRGALPTFPPGGFQGAR